MEKLLLTLTAIIAFCFISKAQNVYFADANFKAAVIANTSINTNGDTEIQLSEANSYSGALNISQQNISDLTGLEEFTSIFNLNCGQNPLNTVDVSSNTSLTSLTVNFTQISTLDVSSLVNLTTFNGTDNQFTDIDLSNNTNLTIIRVANNTLTNLNVKNGNNSNVTFFQAQNNPGLTCIEVDNVAYSTANWNNIDAGVYFSTDCSVAPCTVNIPDANFKAYLVGNSAINTNGNTEIECSEASAFTGSINANSAGILDLTGIEAFTNTTSLSVEGNSLTSLDVSANNALGNLYCAYNMLTSLDISNNPNLQSLACNNNELASINLPSNNSLTFINIIENEFTNFDFTNLTDLEGFRCTGNQLTSLDLSTLTSLTQLFCDDNDLSTLDVSNGNNSNFATSPGGAYLFRASGNPNLTCIEVDDAAWSTTNWTNIDATASFSENCGVVSPVLVNAITVQGQGGVSTISTNGGTLQMEADVLPLNADDATYTWSVVNTSAASISATGLLTALANGDVDVIATANDGSGITGAKTITISNQGVGIKDLAFESLNVYPNPTTGIVNIAVGNEKISSIKIIDLAGRVVKQYSNESQINVSSINVGIYMLEIANEDKRSIVKLIVR